MRNWEWSCEDDEEAMGFATVLRRAGVQVWTRRDPNANSVVRADDTAATLTSLMLAHFARADARERQVALDRRDRRGLMLLAAGLAMLAIAAVVLGA